MEPYKDKTTLHTLYVTKRMGIKEMSEYFQKNYNCKVTPQTIYNWLKNYDLLKYRGKGRNINISRGTAVKPKAGPNGRGGAYGGLTQKKRPKPPWMKRGQR